MKNDLHCTVLAEIEWDFSAGEADPNWKYLMRHATFRHKDACEFLVHIGESSEGRPYFWENTIDEMRRSGCTADFIAAYSQAVKTGAIRVLFWA